MLKLQAIGHLGRDAQVNNANGKTVINFNVAHTEKYTDNAGVKQSKTTWLQCAFWTEKTAVAQYLKKGTQVYVEGIPDVRTYQGQDGQTQANLTVRIHNVQLLGGQQQAAPAQQQTAPTQQTAQATAPVDDTPF